MKQRSAIPVLAVVALSAACAGDGSDIGPRLARLSGESCRVVVLDDAGRGVVGAKVTLVGTSIVATTGRNGRGDLLASPRGTRLVRIDGSAAAAREGDRLASMTVAESIVGTDLPSPIHLPDLTSTADLPVGTQTTTTTLAIGADVVVTVADGVSVGAASGVAELEFGVGQLAANHLPGELPLGATGAVLFGRGVFVSPDEATFSPGIDLDVIDDLAAGTGVVQLYHLDPDTGEWGVVANVTGGGGRLAALGQLTRGGLYAFGVTSSEAAVTGRVIDLDIDGAGADVASPVPTVMVRVDNRRAVTGADGRFAVTGVARRKADDSGRRAQVEVFAGGSWLPVAAATDIDVSNLTPAAPGDIGDLELDTVPATNIRMLQIRRARRDTLRLGRVSAVRGGVAQVACGDADGVTLFEDVPFGFFGVHEGWRSGPGQLDFAQSIGVINAGSRWLDVNLFTQIRSWDVGARNSRIYVCDALGGGPVVGAWVVQGQTAGAGLLAVTLDNGGAFAARDLAGRVTAVARSERDGDGVTHAFSISKPYSDKLELPVQLVHRAPLAAFDRHGVVEGELLGADLGKQHALRATRRIFLGEWWDDVADATLSPLPSRLPIDAVPDTTAAYRVGVATAGGHVVATEFIDAGGVLLEKIGLLLDFVPSEGAVVRQDLSLDLTADATFVVPTFLLDAPTDVDTASFSVALALQLDDTRVVDVARGLRGNVVVAGHDLQLMLPQLGVPLSGRRWLALLQGEKVVGDLTYRHQDLLTLPSSATPRLRPFPTIEAPTSSFVVPGGTASAAGFRVGFTLPEGAVCGSIELRSTDAGEQLRWSAFVRPEETEFRFVTLPADVPSPLVAGRSYELTVSAWFAPAGTYAGVGYGDIVSYAQTIGPRESGVTQITSATFVLDTE